MIKSMRNDSNSVLRPVVLQQSSPNIEPALDCGRYGPLDPDTPI